MVPNENRDTGKDDNDQVARIVGELAPSLTIIHGYAQLLQRRIRSSNDTNTDDLLRGLARIEKPAREIDGRLRQIEYDNIGHDR